MNAFEDQSDFNRDISKWNTHNVVTMSRMFFSAVSFDQSLNNWDVSNVTTMYVCLMALSPLINH